MQINFYCEVIEIRKLEKAIWDIQKTKNYYEYNDTCDCAYCRIFYLTVDKFYPALSNFLNQFGLTMNKPEEALHVYRDNDGLLHYEAWYGVSRIFERGIRASFI